MNVTTPQLGTISVLYDWWIQTERAETVNNVPTGAVSVSGPVLVDVSAHPTLQSTLDGEAFQEFDISDVYGNTAVGLDRVRGQFTKWVTRPAPQRPKHTQAEWVALFQAGHVVLGGFGATWNDGESLSAFATRVTPLIETVVTEIVLARELIITKRAAYVGRGISG